jgi:hypothetical protein
VSEPTERPDEETTINELSPELALVDADLARIARSRMPNRPGFSAPPAPESVGSVGEPRARSEPLDGVESPPQSEPPPRTLRAAIASGRSRPPAATVVSGDERSVIASAPARTHLVVGGGAAGARRNGDAVAESPDFSEDRPARRRLRLRTLVAGLLLSLAALALAATSLSGDDGASDRVATPVAAAPRGAPQAEERPRTKGRRFAPRSSREPPPAAARAVPGRPARRQRSSPPASVFVWLPVRGASYYKVEFFRGGRKVFQATTAKARLELPRRWTFKGRRFEVTPGNYRWSVRPGFGAGSKARYGATIVASRWTVPA